MFMIELSEALNCKIQQYQQNYFYKESYTYNRFNVGNGTEITEYSYNNFVTFTRDDGVMLMARVMNNFTSDTSQATPYESFMYDVEQGNLKLVGIPEQVGPTPVPPTPTDEYAEAFDILNDVDGQQDEYTEPGGTDEEIEEILDEILGNE